MKQAFPVIDNKNTSAHYECTDPGMTLRDYFAGQALPAILKDVWEAFYSGKYGLDDNWRENIAIETYLLADAMMKARGQE